MKSVYIYKFFALSSIVSGLLQIIGWTLDIDRNSLIGAELVLGGYVLAIFAFMGITSIQRKKLKVLGGIGFILIIIANALFICWVFMDIARLSGMAPSVNWYQIERNGPTGVIGTIGGASFVLGYLLFGIDTFRAGVLNKWAAVILILAGLQPLLYPWIGVGKLLARIGGIALILFGWNIWKLIELKVISDIKEKM